MSERTDALKLAEKILNRPHADPDDDLAMLSRQLLKGQEMIDKLKSELEESFDPGSDLIHANRDSILRIHEDGLRRVKRCLNRSLEVYTNKDVLTALEVIQAVNTFHPMHGES